MERRFLSLGECMVEMAPSGAERTFTMGFAGDTLNTAWYARRCLPREWAVDYFTAVGTDTVSDRMVAFFEESGIGTATIIRRDDRTVGLYLIELLNGERSFAYWRSQSAARRLADDPRRLSRTLEGAGLAYFSGITLAVLEGEGRANLLAALAAARAAGTMIAFDPNLRPRLWPDEKTMCAAVSQAAALADIVVPSFEDEARHFGDPDPEATLARYGRAGARTVAVKNGPGAILYRHGGETGGFTPEPVAEVVDTTAAGDSFNAAFLATLLAGGSAEQAVADGARLAGRVVGARGALIG